MNCPYCGTELRDGVRYCTACGVAVNGVSADSGLRVKPRNHVAAILICMLIIGIIGGSCLGLYLRQIFFPLYIGSFGACYRAQHLCRRLGYR